MNSIDQALEKLKNAASENKRGAFLEYCRVCIEEKNKGILREEEVAYKICGCMFLKKGLSDISELDDIIMYACDMEIPRESSFGAGISLSDKWNEKNADDYKRKQWEEFVLLYEQVKEK
jgi:hypothetical protein